MDDPASQLVGARDARRIVRLERSRIDESDLDGYVVDVAPALFQLLVIDENIDLNGFCVLRVADVTELESPLYKAEFYERALELRGRSLGSMPEAVDLRTMATAIASAAERFPLVTIYCEALAPNECYIGRVHALDDTVLGLHSINTDATWDVGTLEFDLADITRLDFGGRYEEALWLVGGDVWPGFPAEGPDASTRSST